jgi:hypothetical protein
MARWEMPSAMAPEARWYTEKLAAALLLDAPPQ